MKGEDERGRKARGVVFCLVTAADSIAGEER